MCTENQLMKITTSVADEAKRILTEKLDAVILYGSYARGDYDDESDIDILVRIKCSKDELSSYRRSFTHCASELSLEYGITVSVQLTDTESFDKYKDCLLYYKNIQKDGVFVA